MCGQVRFNRRAPPIQLYERRETGRRETDTHTMEPFKIIMPGRRRGDNDGTGCNAMPFEAEYGPRKRDAPLNNNVIIS